MKENFDGESLEALRARARELEAQLSHQHVALAEAHVQKKLSEMVTLVRGWHHLMSAPGSNVEDFAEVLVSIESQHPEAFKAIVQQCNAWQAQQDYALRLRAGSNAIQ